MTDMNSYVQQRDAICARLAREQRGLSLPDRVRLAESALASCGVHRPTVHASRIAPAVPRQVPRPVAPRVPAGPNTPDPLLRLAAKGAIKDHTQADAAIREALPAYATWPAEAQAKARKRVIAAGRSQQFGVQLSKAAGKAIVFASAYPSQGGASNPTAMVLGYLAATDPNWRKLTYEDQFKAALRFKRQNALI